MLGGPQRGPGRFGEEIKLLILPECGFGQLSELLHTDRRMTTKIIDAVCYVSLRTLSKKEKKIAQWLVLKMSRSKTLCYSLTLRQAKDNYTNILNFIFILTTVI